MSKGAGNDQDLVPTAVDLGLPFPVAVLSLEDAAALGTKQLVVLVSGKENDPSVGIPLTVCPPRHGEAVLGWSLLAFVQFVERGELSDALDSLLDEYPAYVMCAYRVAEMLLGLQGDSIDRGLLLKQSTGDAVFLDANDLRLVSNSAHHPTSCGCAPGRMLPFKELVESLIADDAAGEPLSHPPTGAS